MNIDTGVVRESPIAILIRGIPDGCDGKKHLTLHVTLKRGHIDGAFALLGFVADGMVNIPEEDGIILRKICRMNLLPDRLRLFRVVPTTAFSNSDFEEVMLPHLKKLEVDYRT